VHPSQFLVTLKLSKCNLGEAGGLAIAAALRAGNLGLRVLLLSHNGLGNKSAAAFGDLLESSHTLKELDLSWNQIKVGFHTTCSGSVTLS
jgi:Ran GTPase-activating protein (RanGAP) involved in mRNA processing and transport